MKHFAALLLSATMAHAGALQLPEAPKPHLDRINLALLASDASLRMLDAYSTERALRCPRNRELTLPGAIVNHPPAMYAYSASVVALDWFLSRELRRHGHPKLARLPYIIDIGVEIPTLHNFAMPTKARP